jgi:uncharacterized protein
MVTPFTDANGEPAVRGFLHVPNTASGDGIVLSHGAGSNSQSKVLLAMAEALSGSGFEVLRIDLPFRQERPHGPPFPSSASKDRDGIRRALMLLRSRVNGRVFAGGHSYGGRQTTILVSEEPQLAEGVLLLSYPLHPPGKPNQLRTSHFPKLTRPAFFAHGTRDPFGSTEEMRSALKLISGSHSLMDVEGAGHDLRPQKRSSDLHSQIASEFQLFIDGLKTE